MGIKKLLPFEDCILNTRLSPLEVQRRMAGAIDTAQGFSWPYPGRQYAKPYKGTCAGNTFTMERNINYRNSFLPEITGTIQPATGGTRVIVTMRLNILVLIFISLWLSATGLISIGLLVVQYTKVIKGGSSPVSVIPFALFVFGCIITSGGFKYESGSSKRFLITLLDAVEQGDE